MSRGARLAATLLALCTGGCVDLSPPSELQQSRDGGEIAAADGPAAQPTATEPDSGVVADTEPAADAVEPDAPPAADAPEADAGVDAVTPDGRPDAQPGSDGGTDAGDARASDGAAATLTIDDFGDGTVTPNGLGAPVTGDNQILRADGGELSFQWNASSVFQSFRELLSPSSCALDIRAYRKFSLRMRASVPGKEVKIYHGRTNATCTSRTFVALGTISPTTAMTTFSVDLQTVDREGAASFEWQPPPDATVYTLDDIQLVP